MIHSFNRHCLLSAILVLVGFCVLSVNRSFGEDEKSQQILESIQERQASGELSYEAIYNQGVAEYRDGNYEDARQLFTRSTAVADRRLEA